MSHRDPRIFISYRREDTAAYAGWLQDRLGQQFGVRNIFKDATSLQAGHDFPRMIGQAVAGCDVLVALIGPHWAGPPGQSRLHDPADWVRLEIEAAFSHGIRVIPMVSRDAPPLRPGALPPGLDPLRSRQMLPFHPDTFAEDVRRLIAVIESNGGPAFGTGQGNRLTSSRVQRFAELQRLYESQIEVDAPPYRYDPLMKAESRREVLDAMVDALDDGERPANLALANLQDGPGTWREGLGRRGLVAVVPRRLVYVPHRGRIPVYLPFAQILRVQLRLTRTSITLTLPDRNIEVFSFKPFVRAAEFAKYMRERLPAP
ncbi:toll/interleukin-1 receptor domain-containing protein [Actinoplanes sp. NPDC049681]|uniref:toll/interleukin-1 receptor domain-containing protein n=1 Tax=Actinoplanes sp. NPDC049681 TaxID=3363905 RepID=UPI0037B9695E